MAPTAFASSALKIVSSPNIYSYEEELIAAGIDPQLGRFTLRDQGQTIAIGKITKLLLDVAPAA